MKNELLLAYGVSCLVALSACESSEPLRETAYFEGLGFEKSLQYVRSCTDEKKALLAKQDAEGLDRFAKSSRGKNCRTGFDYASKQEAELVRSKATLLQAATTEDELNQAQNRISGETDARWGDTFKVFPDWKPTEINNAYYSLGRTSSTRLSEIMISKMRR